MPRITFLGVGDATCAEAGNTSLLYAGRRSILIDCGPTVPQALGRAAPDPEALDAIWITHQHADHCFGLPTLLLTLRLAGRKKPLHLMGGPGSQSFVNALLDLGYPGSFRSDKCFPIVLSEIDVGRPFEFEGLSLTPARTQHRVVCHALRIDDGTKAICASGDGKLSPNTLELYRGADLVVHECQWATKVADDHSCGSDLRRLLDEAAVSRIAVVHCGNGERQAIAEQLARDMPELAWLPRAGEFRDY